MRQASARVSPILPSGTYLMTSVYRTGRLTVSDVRCRQHRPSGRCDANGGIVAFTKLWSSIRSRSMVSHVAGDREVRVSQNAWQLKTDQKVEKAGRESGSSKRAATTHRRHDEGTPYACGEAGTAGFRRGHVARGRRPRADCRPIRSALSLSPECERRAGRPPTLHVRLARSR